MKKKSKKRKQRKPLKQTKRALKKQKAAAKRVSRGDDYKPIKLDQYDIIFEPLQADEYAHLVPTEVLDVLEEIYFLLDEEPLEMIGRLDSLKEKYPEYPRIYNYLAKAYMLVGEPKKMVEVIEENYRRNPDYLFAKVNYADMCLKENALEKIPAIFDHKFNLKLLYPKRNVFHVTEAVAFFGLLGKYFFRINDMEKAKAMLELLEDIDPDDVDTRVLREQIRISKALRGFAGLFKQEMQSRMAKEITTGALDAREQEHLLPVAEKFAGQNQTEFKKGFEKMHEKLKKS